MRDEAMSRSGTGCTATRLATMTTKSRAHNEVEHDLRQISDAIRRLGLSECSERRRSSTSTEALFR